ncbi:MAG: hypothetical protein ACLFPF_05515 [Halanaerobiales bacterium]
MDIIRIIAEGIRSDQLSMAVFYILGLMFLIDIFLYVRIWFNIISLNRKLKNGFIYKPPLRRLVEGFEELINISLSDVNTRAYIEDFFSLYKVSLIPLPLFDVFKIPLISAIKFIKDTVSLFILVGVLGTFVGIYTSLVNVLNGSEGLLAGLDSISPVLSGMGTAFATSIIGMSLALTTTFILKLFNAEQFLAGLMARTENYLDNEIKIAKKSFLNKEIKNIERCLKEGFNQLIEYNIKIHNDLKGFEQFSHQFEEAAGYMENFNTNLSGSMEDLKDFYQTNRDFTRDFTEDVHILAVKLENLFSSIDALNRHQNQIADLIENNYDIQEESIDALKNISKQSSKSQKELKENYQLFREQLKNERERINGLHENLQITGKQQKDLVENYQYIVEGIDTLRKEVAVTFENNVKQLSSSLAELKNSYNSEMNRNVKTFSEHVGLSNKIITEGLDSLAEKFDENESTMAKYLGGLAFNASDLEGAIKDLSKAVRDIENNIDQHNRSVKKLNEMIEKEIRERDKDAGSE